MLRAADRVILPGEDRPVYGKLRMGGPNLPSDDGGYRTEPIVRDERTKGRIDPPEEPMEIQVGLSVGFPNEQRAAPPAVPSKKQKRPKQTVAGLNEAYKLDSETVKMRVERAQDRKVEHKSIASVRTKPAIAVVPTLQERSEVPDDPHPKFLGLAKQVEELSAA